LPPNFPPVQHTPHHRTSRDSLAYFKPPHERSVEFINVTAGEQVQDASNWRSVLPERHITTAEPNRVSPQLSQPLGLLLSVHGGQENVEEIGSCVVRSGLRYGAHHSAEGEC
jgi:hypothetical protein